MRSPILVAAVLLAACSGAPEVADSGMQLPKDSGSADASVSEDSGTPAQDSGVLDAGAPDAATPDAGTPDAGKPDAGTPDSGTTQPDAGPKDAGLTPTDSGRNFSTDRALFFGASRCSTSLRFCDDFENGAIDTQKWSISGPTNLAVSTGDKARGTRALHMTKTGNGNAYVKHSKSFPMPNNDYYGRAFIKFIKLPVKPMMYSHWTIIAASGNVVNGEIRVGGQLPTNANNPQVWGVGTDNRTQDAGTGDWTNSDKDPNNNPRAVPVNEWMCIEWAHLGSVDETHFWWDGVEHPSLRTTQAMHGGNTNPFILPEFTNVWLGWAEYQASTQDFELWIDEVALDTQRIGCVE